MAGIDSHPDWILTAIRPADYRMKQFVKSLQEANGRLDDGKGHHIRSAADAIRWLVQSIGVAMSAEPAARLAAGVVDSCD